MPDTYSHPERADVTRKLADAFAIPTDALHDLGTEKSLAVVFSVVHGIVAEYLAGGDQISEATPDECSTCSRPYAEHDRRDERCPSRDVAAHAEHDCDPDESDLVYQGHVAAPGYGVSFECRTCGRAWLKIGPSFVDPSEQLYELSPEDVR